MHVCIYLWQKSKFQWQEKKGKCSSFTAKSLTIVRLCRYLHCTLAVNTLSGHEFFRDCLVRTRLLDSLKKVSHAFPCKT